MDMIGPERVYRHGYGGRVAVGLVTVVIIAIAVAVALDESPLNVVAMTIAIVAFALGAFGFVWLSKVQLLVNERGIRRDTMFGSVEMTWDEIVEYRYRILSNQAAMFHAGGVIGWLIVAMMQKKRKAALNFDLRLVGRGEAIAVTATYAKAQEIKNLLLGKLHARMLPAFREKLVRLEPVEFGPVTLTGDSLRFKKISVPLSEITTIDLTGLALVIKKEGKLFAALTVASNKVPNVLALIEILQEAIQRRAGRPLPPEAVKVY
ncbi:MAG TPA: DUF6585 family protein [Thermoanaerobaculia bacterium]|nr:DUF6585 family protein [Thermoanaerobaculia bacterium]